MSEIKSYLFEITEEALKLGIDLEANMNPPATPAEIMLEKESLLFDIPQELVDFYSWRNGVKLDTGGGEVRMFPRFYFLSWQRSFEITKILTSSIDEWPCSWFALCADLAGDYYAIDTARRGQNFGRIFSVQEESEPFPAFLSFEFMLRSVLECYRCGVYYLDEDGLLQENGQEAQKIYQRFNNGYCPTLK